MKPTRFDIDYLEAEADHVFEFLWIAGNLRFHMGFAPSVLIYKSLIFPIKGFKRSMHVHSGVILESAVEWEMPEGLPVNKTEIEVQKLQLWMFFWE